MKLNRIFAVTAVCFAASLQAQNQPTAESLIDELARRERAYADTSSTTELYLNFKTLVARYPKKSAELGVILSTARADGPTMKVLSGAFGAVGSHESQDALMVAMRGREQNWPVMATLIPSLGGVDIPLPEAIEYMRHLAFDSTNPDIASAARLALETMMRRARPGRALDGRGKR